MASIIVSVFLVGLSVALFARAKRRKAVEFWHYCYLGMCVYNVFLNITHGLLWDGVDVFWWFCFLGCIASYWWSAWRIVRERRKYKKRAKEQLKAMIERGKIMVAQKSEVP